MSMKPSPWPEPAEQIVAAVQAIYHGRKVPLPVAVRDQLGELFADAQFCKGFGVRGKPGWSPGRLALITVLQRAENLSDRAAAEAVRDKLSWKYALGLTLDDPGFDASVLSEFRTRVVEHGLQERALDLLLEALQNKGLVSSGGQQRTDSTQVIAAVRDLNRLELAGETVRACLEALAVAAPGWLTAAIDISDWGTRYSARVDSWRLPTSKTARAELALAYGTDGYTLLHAVYAPNSPGWLRELSAVEVLRLVLLQNYTRTTTGKERKVVVTQRKSDTDGLPPGRSRLSSPYDLDARWGSKRGTYWNGYKVHLTETCRAPGNQEARSGTGNAHPTEPPNMITHVATTDATGSDAVMLKPIHQALRQRDLLPCEHYVDSGYPSTTLITDSVRDFGIDLITPIHLDTSPQARAGKGFSSMAFAIDFDARHATCPQGKISSHWHEASQRGHDVVVIRFTTPTCRPCPVRNQCTTGARGRSLTVPPQQAHEVQLAARATQNSKEWQEKYALRAGVEGTIHQAVAVTGLRHARYRGLGKTHLQHIFSAVALNLIRLNAWWNDNPLDRGRTSHLTRLELALAS